MVSRGFLLSLLVFVAAFYLGLNLLVRWIYPKQLFPYRGSSYEEHSALRWADSSDGNRIALWFSPAAEDNAPLILYFHGNGEDIGMNEDRFQWMNERGFSVLAADYPGYGLSTGTPSPDSVRACADATARYAAETLGISPDRTVIWGRSLGGAPAIYLAARESYRGLVLEAAFRSVLSLAPPIPLLIDEPFPNEQLLADVDCPTFIFHGARDRVIPASHAKALHRAAGNDAVLVLFEDGTHNDLRFIGEADFEETLQNLNSLK